MIRSRPLLAAPAIVLVMAACGGASTAQQAALQQAAQQQGASGAQNAQGNSNANGSGTNPNAAVPGTGTSAQSSSAAQPGSAPGGAAAAPAQGAGGAPAPAAGSKPGGTVPGPPKPGGVLPQPGAGGATDTGVTASSIKLGHIGIYSGPVGSFGANLSYACRATLQTANDQGGINGRKYDVLVRDDAWDATKGSAAVRDLVERQNVFAMACTQSVPTNDAITPYLDQQKVPNVGNDGWGEAQYGGAWSFPVGASAYNEAQNLADYQVAHGTRKAGVLYLNNTTGQAFADAYTKILEASGGQMAVRQAANFDDPGTSTFLAQCRVNNVDTITTMVDPGIFARMVREAAAQGYKPVHGYSGNAALYFEVTPSFTGPTAVGTIAAIDWTPDDPAGPSAGSAGYRQYKQTVEHYYPNIDHSNWTKAAYVGGTMLNEALHRLGLNLTRQRLKDDLDRLVGFDTGLGPKITFSVGHHRSNKTTYLVQLQDVGGKLAWKYIAGPIVNPHVQS
ncbi:MAG TPA: ABC transporter substrate-binding protein [Candidatus Dormibacteraeota bacterium]|nr:ABC transporter substrate-binding protein [Candidatus Dormibacteraeota bacterium]